MNVLVAIAEAAAGSAIGVGFILLVGQQLVSLKTKQLAAKSRKAAEERIAAREDPKRPAMAIPRGKR